MGTPEKIRVGLGEKSYDIYVGTGLIARAGEFLQPHLNRDRVVVVTDETVGGLYLSPLSGALAEAGIAVEAITLPPGEKTKSFEQLETLCNQLIALKVERSDLIIALGGGVIGDLTGFAAAILRRGCRFLQIPTTLLAQVDSSVGGKTAINASHGKNLIGAFHQPVQVLADIDVLQSLPERELRAGYAEVAKYGLLGDAEFFAWLEENGADLLNGDASLRAAAVTHSVKAKAKIVELDEKEHGLRALLNLGHTFGHAFEAETGFSERLLHGEAVALGMVMAFEYSATKGFCAHEDATKVRAHLAATGLPVNTKDIDGLDTSAEALLDHIFQDKKVTSGQLTFILAKGIGEAFIANDVPPAEIRNFLSAKLDP
ncbi:3-dehydroquinate synthase [Parvularcula sp. IMCC14364]|uniref:3-dehydroquinate synthase n=1 Tax=Parvularcula sp. IMCC14364 TaxID=3067902 RepID=UPI0027429516|nr:3-dehydroquinate synthase [Parvularcula sp. IMCC14364]